ncbi:MAG: hypothetical protein N4A41_08105 [Crocinitomicaceae bacterium]|jgi:hypothetical protein|nr:hypothetical protein [Crocinitomicaceae bacterium]
MSFKQPFYRILSALFLIGFLLLSFREIGDKPNQLQEWGIKGKVKLIECWYTYDSTLWDIDHLDQPVIWNRKTRAYYNRSGNVDSIIVWNDTYEETLTEITRYSYQDGKMLGVFEKEGVPETNIVLQWLSDSVYQVELRSSAGEAYRYVNFMDPEGRLSLTKAAKLENNTWVDLGEERTYFSKTGNLDSIVSIYSRHKEVMANKDYLFDAYNNAIKSVKQKSGKSPYLVTRQFDYYED